MYECCANPSHLCQFPTELLICLFKFLPAKDLIVCRQVCRRWKIVIDHVSSDDNLWQKFCERDFKTLYKDAKMKSISCLWFDIYRSLKLWGRLAEASEFRDEFCHPSVRADEIQDVSVLKDGVMLVHKRFSVVYYNILTLKKTDRNPVLGSFAKFLENDDAFIILGSPFRIHLHLLIIKKLKLEKQQDLSDEEIQQAGQKSTFYNTKYFVTIGKNVYFVDFNNAIFHCNIDGELTATPLSHNYTDTVITLSFYNGHLHMLSLESNVYIYQNNTFVKLFNLESKKSNIFDCLWQYRFLETIHWRTFYLLVTNLRIHIPDGPLKYICMMRIYGDTFFIGCKNGIVLIYYRPYVDGHLDFFSHVPVKQYRFAERDDDPVLLLRPILKVEIVEIIGGHKIFVAMPKKVIILTYTHNLKVVTSKAVMPHTQTGPLALKN